MGKVNTGTCPFCSKVNIIDVPDILVDKAVAFVADRYKFGFVQDEFPTLSDGQREALVTHAHEACFDEAFPEEDDD
jgi:hypothetical protein